MIGTPEWVGNTESLFVDTPKIRDNNYYFHIIIL